MSAANRQSSTSGKKRAKPRIGIEEHLEQLALLRTAPLDDLLPALENALESRVNVVAAKAAQIAAARQVHDLIPGLVASFERFFEKPAASDPQCLAKHAVVKALKDLDYAEHAPFLHGFRHIQMEPTWGGQVDTAVNLRAECALGIAASTDIPRLEKMKILVDGSMDREHIVRIEILRALEQLDGDDSMLLLRLKALLGDSEPAVVGQAIESVLRIEGERAIPWAHQFVKNSGDRIREETALAISASKMPGAVPTLISAWKEEKVASVRSVCLRALGQLRDATAFEFLLTVIETSPAFDAIDALYALSPFDSRPESVTRIAQAVKLRNQDHVRAEFHKLFPALPSTEA
jgi:hypothetical protein